MIIADLFEIDFYIFTDIKILFNLGVRIKYIILNVFEIDFHIFTDIKILFNLGVRINYI